MITVMIMFKRMIIIMILITIMVLIVKNQMHGIFYGPHEEDDVDA